jgi:hypothetical protein
MKNSPTLPLLRQVVCPWQGDEKWARMPWHPGPFSGLLRTMAEQQLVNG